MDQKATFNSLKPLELFIFAGETSGDRIGAELIQALLSMNPHLKITAVAGPSMRNLPITTFLEMEEFQVMGFIDVLKALPKILKLFKKIKNYLLKTSPQVIILIDYPGFNLRLARFLRKGGFKGFLIQYVCPSVWAWKKGRIQSMSHHLDLLLTLFPFEKQCFAHTNLHVEYVGHPLARTIRHHQPSPDFPKFTQPLFSIFPGSRVKEVERNLPLQLKAAIDLAYNDYTLVISCAHKTLLPLINHEILKYPAHTIHILHAKHNYDLMHHSAIAFATSGTITLELALHQVPTLVTYAMNSFDTFLAKKIFKINLPHYCIVNYTAHMRIFPEFFGPDFNQIQIYKTLSLMLNTPAELKKCKKECALFTHLLKNEDNLAAQHILRLTETL